MVERRGIITEKDISDPKQVNSWPLPSLQQRGKVVHSAKREGEERAKEAVENVSRSARPKHLTAEDITKITKEAEEEGFTAGYQEGFSKGEIQGEIKGRSEGEAKAYQEYKTRLEDEYNRLQAICDQLSDPLGIQDKALENTLMDMTHHFACQLIQKEIEKNPESLRTLVSKVLQALPAGSNNITIFLHPDDGLLIEKHLEGKNQNWPIQTDESLTRGGCRVETRESIVDFSIEKRWQALLDHINTFAEQNDANNDAE